MPSCSLLRLTALSLIVAMVTACDALHANICDIYENQSLCNNKLHFEEIAQITTSPDITKRSFLDVYKRQEQDQKTLAHNIELKRVTSRNHILLGTLIATILAGIGTVSTLAGSANAGHDLRKIGDESIDKHTNASSRPRS